MPLPNIGKDANLNGAIPFSKSSEWNIRIDYAPLAANSAAIIAAINPTKGLKADFGANWVDDDGTVYEIGIPYIVVPENEPLTKFFESHWPDEGDDGPFPIPANAPIEGGTDDHVIVVQLSSTAPNGLGYLYELFEASYDAQTGTWSGQAAKFDLQGGDHQRDALFFNADEAFGYTSADAAGLPIFPGLVRFDETKNAIANNAETLGHALRFTLTQAHTAFPFLGMATHSTNDGGDGAAPFGGHFRLRSDFVIPPGTSPELTVIINTMKQYGMILADNGSDWFVSGTPNEGWSNDDLRKMNLIKGGDFEMIDSSKVLEMVNGTQATDQLNGTSATNRMAGHGGDDLINAVGGNDFLYGGTGIDNLKGGFGKDQLNGEIGQDILTGGAGIDSFVFDSAILATNRDRITDFSAIADTIILDNDVFTALSAGALTADAFRRGPSAADADDRIIYNKASGVLSYDADGTGDTAAIQFAVLGNRAVITYADFLVI